VDLGFVSGVSFYLAFGPVTASMFSGGVVPPIYYTDFFFFA
jgi:hypothetical protein